MTKQHPLEADVKTAVKKVLARRGWFFWMPVPNRFGGSGVSDFICFRQGKLLVIETKKGKVRKGSELQEGFMETIRLQGGYSRVVNHENVGDLDDFLVALEAS